MTTKISFEAAQDLIQTIDNAERLGFTGAGISLSAAGFYRIADEDNGLEGAYLEELRREATAASAFLTSRNRGF